MKNTWRWIAVLGLVLLVSVVQAERAYVIDPPQQLGTLDMQGQPRYYNGRSDMGAYEAIFPIPAVGGVP